MSALSCFMIRSARGRVRAAGIRALGRGAANHPGRRFSLSGQAGRLVRFGWSRGPLARRRSEGDSSRCWSTVPRTVLGTVREPVQVACMGQDDSIIVRRSRRAVRTLRWPPGLRPTRYHHIVIGRIDPGCILEVISRTFPSRIARSRGPLLKYRSWDAPAEAS